MGVNVTPNTLSWVITKPSWITISGASGVGDDSVINGFASVNGSNSNSRTGTIFLSTTGGASLDFITVTQLPSSFSGGQESQE